MFDKLVEFIARFWDWAKPFEVVLAFEGGVMLRAGKYQRTLGPGWHWKIPFVDYAITAHTTITTIQLRPQTLTTKDGVQVVIGSIVKYKIADPKPFLLDIWDSTDVLADVTLGAIKGVVNSLTYDELIAAPAEQQVLDQVRRECNQFGFRINRVTFTDMGRIRTLRLMITPDSKSSPADYAITTQPV